MAKINKLKYESNKLKLAHNPDQSRNN